MRVNHYTNKMDSWYSCPASGECTDDLYIGDTLTCTCNAGEINNELNKLELTIERYKQMLNDEIIEHKQELQQSHRQGWEQAKREAIDICGNGYKRGLGDKFQGDVFAEAIASMEYKGGQR